jgi:hypothetical protein
VVRQFHHGNDDTVTHRNWFLVDARRQFRPEIREFGLLHDK